MIKDIHELVKMDQVLKGYARKIVYDTQGRSDENLANEILQEAYIKLLDKKNISKRYVFLTIHNCLIDVFRQKQPVDYQDNEQIADDEYDYEDDYITTWQIDKVNEILQSLGEFNNIQEFYKNTLCGMYYGEGLSYRKIEAKTGIAYNSVRNTIRQELKLIKDKANEERDDLLQG